jgi:MFS family permease
MRRYRELLAKREYRLLWGGATASALGDGMTFVALVWLTLERGGDAALVGWMAAAYTAPVVVGGLAAGVILDRFDKRLVLVADNVVRGLAVASIPIASALGVLSVGQIFVVAAIYGLLYMITVAGMPSILPLLVDESELTTANAMETLTWAFAGLVGPAAAGLVIAFVGASTVLAVDALSYATFVLCLLAMRPLPLAVGGAMRMGPHSLERPSRGIGPAVRFVLAAPAILTITLMYMLVNIGETMVTVLTPFYARMVSDAGSTAYGILASAFSGGVIVGALVVGAMGWRWTLGRSIAAAVTLTGIIVSALLLHPPLGGAAAVLGLAGLTASCLTTWAQTIRMRLIPPELRGRVFALLRTAMQSTPPIGAILAGFLLARVGLDAVVVATVVVTVVPGLIGLVIPSLSPGAVGDTSRTAVPAAA